MRHRSGWWWVRRFGALDCGCTRNPLTRRIALFRIGCPQHCDIDPSDIALFEGDGPDRTGES